VHVYQWSEWFVWLYHEGGCSACVKQSERVCVCALITMIHECCSWSFLEACTVLHIGDGTKRAHPPAHIWMSCVTYAWVMTLECHACELAMIWVMYDSYLRLIFSFSTRGTRNPKRISEAGTGSKRAENACARAREESIATQVSGQQFREWAVREKKEKEIHCLLSSIHLYPPSFLLPESPINVARLFGWFGDYAARMDL